MQFDLKTLVAPLHTVIVTHECQNNVLGAEPVFPELAAIARNTVIPNGQLLLGAARTAKIPVIHCVAADRWDGQGSSKNAPIFRLKQTVRRQVKSPSDPADRGLPLPQSSQVIAEFGPDQSDMVLSRSHGIGAMGGTDLAPILRNMGIKTIVAVGVSLNLGMISFVTDAVNNGFEVVLPTDAVAGVPEDYARDMVRNTFALLATLVESRQLVEVWNQ